MDGPAALVRLRERRLQAGLSQEALAERAGVSRQTVAGIEAGAHAATVAVALRLARALGCRVEDIFALPAEDTAHLAGADLEDGRVAVGRLRGRAVARPLRGLGGGAWPLAPAHGLAAPARRGQTVRVRRLGARPDAVFLVGCDPALGLLAAHAGALWWPSGNAAAVAQLLHGEAHAGGVHGWQGQVPPGVARYRLAAWRMGWLVRRGNPAGIQGAPDLARPGVRVAAREVGAGARALLDAELAAAGVVAAELREFASHAEVAQAVALGAADVGVGPEVAAWAAGLDFLPLVTETCDLWVAEGAEPLLHALHSGAFRAELAAFGPYDTAHTGDRL